MVGSLIATCWVTMSSTSVQQLREIAEAMGLTGSEFSKFVKDQQDLEREERERQREDKVKEDERLEKQRMFELKREEKASIELSLIHISEPTRLGMISYAVFFPPLQS